MEQKNDLESGFRIVNIILLEEIFKREIIVTFNDPKIQQHINVDVSVQIKDRTVNVTETVDLSQEFNGATEFTLKIKSVGIFEFVGESKLSLEDFGNVNGAAIIFPYIRESITSIAIKAGLGLIFIPPFDFTKQKANVERASGKSK